MFDKWKNSKKYNDNYIMTKKTVLHLVKKLTNEIKNAAQEIEKEKNKKIQMLTKILNHALLKQKLSK